MNTGLVHLLVVSGQHFVLLESMLEFLTKKLPPIARSAVASVILCSFVLMTGASPPALRSGFSWFARRANDSFHLGWTPGQIVVLSVIACVSFCHGGGDVLSLTLSAVAAAALAIGSGPHTESWWTRTRVAVTTQLRIYVLLIPALGVFTFQHPLSILWNLTIGAAIGHFLFPMSLAAIVVPRMTSIADPLWGATIEIVSTLSAWTPETPQPSGISDAMTLGYAALLLTIVLFRERRMRIVGLASVFLLSFRADANEIVVWNVGQGSWATVIRDETCLHFDTGGEFAPWIQIRASCEGRRNELTFSHWDWDHVSFARKAAKILDGCLLARPGGTSKPSRLRLLDGIDACAERGTSLTENTSHSREKKTSNAESRVFTVSDTIFTGDIPKNEERRLRSLRHVRVLVVPHHGSKTSSSEEFLARISPRMAIVSARASAYGHPHREVVDRLKRLGIAMLKTEEWGSIRIEMKRAKPFELRPSKKSDFLEIRKVCKRDTPC